MNIYKFLSCIQLILSLQQPTLSMSTHFGPRPDSKPLISGDSFRTLAQHVYDEVATIFDPKLVKWGDIIFVSLEYLQSFFTAIHPHIQHPYILISHNHDYPAPGPFRYMLEDPKLLAWFTQNADIVNHPKVIPIPIGLSNHHWPNNSEIVNKVLRMQQRIPLDIRKKYLCYVNFHVDTNPKVRKPIYDFFVQQTFSSIVKDRNYNDYLLDLAQSKFVVSPHGNGLDCHRTWEALYMGSFPIVKTSTLDPLYQDLPVLIVHEWTDVTAQFLEEQYHILQKQTYNYEKLYFRFWENFIKRFQITVRKNRSYMCKAKVV